MEEIFNWFSCNYQWVIGTILSVVIAYHVFFLSKKISSQSRLEHKDKIKKKTDDLIYKIYKENLRSKVYLVNTNRYFKDYPANNAKISGYSTIAAEVKDTRFDGVEFFCSLARGVYKDDAGKLSFKKNENNQEALTVIPVGVVPYEWIEFVDPDGDEFEYRPIFFVKFNGKIYWSWWRRFIPFGYPYKKIIYYRQNDNYQKGRDPRGMEWLLVDETIHDDPYI